MNRQDWLPHSQQMSDAVQLRQNVYGTISMRQGLGMIVVLGLAAGFIPFLVNWFQAAQIGAALPLAQLARAGAELQKSAPQFMPWFPGLPSVETVADLYQTLGGLGQPFPGWLAAGLSALGEWINWPLRWLSLWIGYGLLVMVANKLLGATGTLQRFYAATSFATVPLLLTGLSPIPCVGAVFNILAAAWSFTVYVKANQAFTGFSLTQALLAVVLPVIVLFVLWLLVVGFLLIIGMMLVL
jgi:hypothetical protein